MHAAEARKEWHYAILAQTAAITMTHHAAAIHQLALLMEMGGQCAWNARVMRTEAITLGILKENASVQAFKIKIHNKIEPS